MAAGIVTGIPWVGFHYGFEVTLFISYFCAFVTIFTGLLMISNFQYFSFKELNFKGTVPYMVFVFTIVLLVVIAQNPHEMLFSMCVIYALSGQLDG